MSALNELTLRAWGMSRQAQLMTFIQLLAKHFVGKIQLLYYGLDVEIFFMLYVRKCSNADFTTTRVNFV